jgi:hypothetical protein
VSIEIDRLTAVCAQLGSNPVTHLGLSNKELFHSNMLAWLFQVHPDQATAAFDDLLVADPAQEWTEVLREERHLDLVVWVPGRRGLVIENKTFSLLREEQLTRYSALKWVQSDDPTLVLLSLGHPGWQERERTIAPESGKPRTWRWLSYAELARRLRAVCQDVSVVFDRMLLERYCDVLDNLVELAEMLTTSESDDELVSLPPPVMDQLSKTRLADGLLKLRTDEIGRRIDESVEPGFTRGTPHLSAFAGQGKRWIGWQFQQDQFRLCAIFDDNHLYGNEPRKQRARSEEAKKLADANIWFNFDELERVLGARASRPTRARPDENGFNKYDPNFVYRYRQVRDLTQGELIALGSFYLQAARNVPSLVAA